MASSALLYNQLSFSQTEDGLKLIDRLPSLKGSRVLDLGCGTGYLASVLARLVGPDGTVTGVDPDRERIGLAQEQYGAISNLKFMVGSCEEFPNGPYDVVFSNYVLQWIEDKESVYFKVFENLNVSGKFAFTCSGSVAQVALQLDALMKPGKPKINNYLHIWPPDVHETIASKCGFQMEFKSVGSRKDSFPNIEALMEWMYASTNGKLDYHSIDDTALDKFKESFGGEPASYEFNTMAYIFIKA